MQIFQDIPILSLRSNGASVRAEKRWHFVVTQSARTRHSSRGHLDRGDVDVRRQCIRARLSPSVRRRTQRTGNLYSKSVR